MSIGEQIDTLLEEFGTSIKDDLQQSLRDAGVSFGGQDSKLSNKIRFEIVQKGSAISFQLIMPDYGLIIDKGRGPGGVSKEGQESISQWAKRKGIVGKFAQETLNQRLARQANNKTNRKKKKLVKPSFEKSLKALTYLVSRKIKQNGFKGNEFFTKIVEDGRVEEFKNKLSEIIKTEVLIEIRN